jgi:hypothetical protein
MKLGLGIEKFFIKKAEAEDRSNTTESLTNRIGIKGSVIHPENQYNNPKDEGFLKPKSTFTPIEEAVDSDSGEEQFINKLSDKLEQELEVGEDKYGFVEIIGSLIKTAQKKGEQAVNEVLEKTTEFLTEYREILASGLADARNEKKGEESEGEEYEACQEAFKNIFGGLIHMDGEVEAYRNRFIKLKKPKVNEKGYIELGNKIYYDKRGGGHLSKEEANNANSKSLPGSQNYKKAVEKV